MFEERSLAVLPLTERLNRLDEQVNQLQEDLIERRRYLNSLLPVASLSNDILVEIMWICVQDEDITVTQSSQPDWVSWTCHHWRIIALSTPKLWSFINLNRLRHSRTQEFLRRSKIAPLYIHSNFTIWDEKETEIGAFLSTNFSRIRNIVLRKPLMRAVLTLLLSYLGSCAAPFLEYLSLVGFTRDHLTPTLMRIDSRTVALRQMELRNIPISWDSMVCRGLTSLSLEQTWQGSLHGFAGALRRLSHLKRLSLDVGTRSDLHGHQNWPSTEIVDLPHLQHLSLNGNFDCLKTIMAQLRIPNTILLDLNANLDDATPFDISDLVPHYLTTAMNAHHFRMLSFVACRDSCYFILLDPPKGTDSMCRFRLGTRRQGPRSAEIRGAFIHAGIRFPLPSLTTLSVGIHGMPSNEWVQGLVHFPTLTDLHIFHCGHLEVIYALQHHIGGIDAICPRLLLLSLIHVGDGSILTTAILACFAERSERGYPLRTLHLSGHERTLRDVDVDKLRMHIQNVHTDQSRVPIMDRSTNATFTTLSPWRDMAVNRFCNCLRSYDQDRYW